MFLNLQHKPRCRDIVPRARRPLDLRAHQHGRDTDVELCFVPARDGVRRVETYSSRTLLGKRHKEKNY